MNHGVRNLAFGIVLQQHGVAWARSALAASAFLRTAAKEAAEPFAMSVRGGAAHQQVLMWPSDRLLFDDL